LSDKDGGHEHDPVLEIEYILEIILLDVYRVDRTRFEAFAAIDTPIPVNDRLAALDPHGASRTFLDAMRAADAFAVVDLQRVIKCIFFFHGVFMF
jgi:hypothetical protein